MWKREGREEADEVEGVILPACRESTREVNPETFLYLVMPWGFISGAYFLVVFFS